MAEATPAPRTETILVVDDNAPNRLLAEAMLSTAGYKVVLAESGARALELFEERRPDLVVLDLLMPVMDGFETYRRLRALHDGEETPIIIVTALNDLATVQKAIELAADDFQAKPVNRVELLARVRFLLDARKRRRESPRPVAPKAEDSELQKQREQLSAMVVHDLKHPLSAIYFNAGMLRRELSLSNKGAERVERILRACERLDAMIGNILDVNRCEHGALPLTVAEYEPASLVDEVATAMSARVEANRQKLEVKLEGASSAVRGDRQLMRRVLENLIDNSIKYAPPETTIHLESRVASGLVEFRVRDVGPGIPVEFRGQIFQKYGQLDRDVSLRGRSSKGLGLVFCRLAVEAHQGKIWVEDNDPQGSCFCVRIPVSA